MKHFYSTLPVQTHTYSYTALVTQAIILGYGAIQLQCPLVFAAHLHVDKSSKHIIKLVHYFIIFYLMTFLV